MLRTMLILGTFSATREYFNFFALSKLIPIKFIDSFSRAILQQECGKSNTG